MKNVLYIAGEILYYGIVVFISQLATLFTLWLLGVIKITVV